MAARHLKQKQVFQKTSYLYNQLIFQFFETDQAKAYQQVASTPTMKKFVFFLLSKLRIHVQTKFLRLENFAWFLHHSLDDSKFKNI